MIGPSRCHPHVALTTLPWQAPGEHYHSLTSSLTSAATAGAIFFLPAAFSRAASLLHRWSWSSNPPCIINHCSGRRRMRLSGDPPRPRQKSAVFLSALSTTMGMQGAGSIISTRLSGEPPPSRAVGLVPSLDRGQSIEPRRGCQITLSRIFYFPREGEWWHNHGVSCTVVFF